MSLQAASDAPRSRLRNFAWRHPQWWLAVLVAACWAIVLAATPDTFSTVLCSALGASEGGWLGASLGFLVHWLTMVMAMMLPLALPMARHVASRSLWRHRHRAIAWFTLGTLAPWIAGGVVCGMIVWLAALTGESRAVAIAAFTLAALWPLTAPRRLALRRCHRVLPVAADGADGRRSCLAFGAFHGRACVATCWPLMVAIALAGHHPAAMVIVALVSLAERFWSRLPLVAVAAVPLMLGALNLLSIGR